MKLKQEKRIWLFADDCILYRSIKDRNDCELLQNDLNNLAAWEKKWEWHSILRSAVLSESPEQRDQSLQHTSWNAILLTWKTPHGIWGVELQSNMSWNRHMDQAVKKANSTLGFLRRNLRVSNEQTKSSAYFSMVRANCRVLLNSLEPLYHRIYQEGGNGATTCSQICHQPVPTTPAAWPPC